jgi:putative ATP-dependent endonuclease of the OLD family
MKIRRFALTNVTSYRERVEFNFDNYLNILIGPNGGGKSNLQKALALVLSNYFIHQYDFKHDDNETKIEPVSLWTRRVLERALPRFIGDDRPQEIELVLMPEDSDVANIKAIGANLERFNAELDFYESPMPVYEPLTLLSKIVPGTELAYRIRDLEFEEPSRESGAWGFREYLRTFFIFLRLSSRLKDIRLTSPVFFFFSERTSKGRLDIQSTQFSEQQYYTGFRSAYQAATGENTNLLQWGAQHFARLYWRAVNDAAVRKDAVANDIFRLYPDVQLFTRYMSQLGYEWTFLTDRDSVSYAFALRKDSDGPWLTPEMFSSGEREIVHFLLAMFALNVKDGLVLVDEPELHLHPRWQRIFLGLFREIAPSRNNQLIITTHSPVYVTPDTINSIVRIYRRSGGSTGHIALRAVDLPNKKHLVRMINSQNNERVFFADRAVLVEGISDRLVIASLLDAGSARFANNEAIEIIEVGGKSNFESYKALLSALDTPCHVVADLDYLREVGVPAVRLLFRTDDGKAWEALKDKKTMDGKSAVAALRTAVTDNDATLLSSFLKYLEDRHASLIDPLDADIKRLIDDDVGRLRANGTLILRDGEIEDYLPPGSRDVGAIVEVTVTRQWINQVVQPERREYLALILGELLRLAPTERATLLTEATTGSVAFPVPLSEPARAGGTQVMEAN